MAGPAGSANGHGRAAARRIANNTPARSGLGTAEDTLAKVIGESVALHLAQLLPRVMGGMPWQPGCLFCVHAHKQAMAAHAAACQAAAGAGEDLPEPPALQIQQAITRGPMPPAPGMPAVPVPVCYDHFQAGPGARPVGLVLPDGTPIVAQAR